ncbi:MAG: DNA helicase [Acidimicrobiia bacterium]
MSYAFGTVAVVHPTPDPLLDDLDPEQRDAVTTTALPLAIHAPAGSGKTRVLTRRIAWRAREGFHDADHVLAVTFTRKAAGELSARLRRLGVPGSVTAGTLHAIALAQLRRRALDQGRTPPELLDRKARLLRSIVGGHGPEAVLATTEVAGEIEWAKTRLIRPGDYSTAATAAGREPSRPLGEVAAAYQRYEAEKRRRRLADFEDLVWWCADALERDPEFAAAQRWRFRHLFVDEFQDTSPAQLRLIRAWLGERADLCAVGDPDQAIYGFAGAESGFLSRFPRTFPGGQVVHLRTNYRCSPQIVAAAEALLADGGRRRAGVHAASAAGPSPRVTDYPYEDAEARGVAQALRDAHTGGTPWSELAVLYRTNAQSAAFEEALGRAEIPYRVRGAARFLDRPEVKAALGDLRRVVTLAPHAPLRAHLDALASEEGNEEHREHVDALVRLGDQYVDADGAHATIDGFLAFLTATLRDDAPVDIDAVELLTFHRAKGLEFREVFVTGLERGLVPISHADSPDEKAEERRLLYVALTRAERALHLSLARSRTVGGRVVKRQRSPWIAPIEASWTGGAPEGPADARPARAATRAVAAARAKLTDPRSGPADTLTPADAELFGALVEWRRNQARVAAVPAYVIFDNATLQGIATARPSSRNQLLAISGIGPVRAERHGDAVLRIVAASSSVAR